MDNEKKQVTYNSSITGETQVTFDIQQYMNNRAMFIGLMCNEDGYEEPFGDVTVNLSVAAPNYCGYLNVNDMPDIEIVDLENDTMQDTDSGNFHSGNTRSGSVHNFHTDSDDDIEAVSYTHLTLPTIYSV